jgi:hypothetical protein
LRLIYPDVTHPYYVVAAPYIRTSAGICALHLLCHSLNVNGRTAYLLPYPASLHKPSETNSELLTPHLTEDIARRHIESNNLPIVVYPEAVRGNPFGAVCVVRYVMNFPGLLGGDRAYPAEELRFGYSRSLAAAAGEPENILFLPATDTRIFKPPARPQARSGTCFYADKYKKVHGGKLYDVTRNSIEITRGESDSQTPGDIAALFHRSELFFTYENTALATEAVLCGCPAVFIPNPYLTEIIAANELGMDGYAWGTEPKEISRAKATVAQGASNYLRTYDIYWRDLERFIAATQRHAEQRRGAVLASREKSRKLERGLEIAPSASLLSRLSIGAEREIAKLLVTLGFARMGTAIWNDAVRRRTTESVRRIIALMRTG